MFKITGIFTESVLNYIRYSQLIDATDIVIPVDNGKINVLTSTPGAIIHKSFRVSHALKGLKR